MCVSSLKYDLSLINHNKDNIYKEMCTLQRY